MTDRIKMLTENNLMTIALLNLEFSIPKLGSISISRIVTNVVILLSTYSQLHTTFLRFQSSLWNFVSLLMSITWILTTPAFLLADFKGNRIVEKMYKDILDIDGAVANNLSCQKDWKLLLMFGVFPLFVLGSVLLSLEPGMDLPEILPLWSAALVQADVLRLAIFKYLVAKRLRHLRTAEELMEDVETVIINTRKLLNLDAKLNSASGILITIFYIYGFQLIIYPPYTMWAIYGPGIKVPTTYEYLLKSTLITYVANLLFPLLMVTCSSMITNEVDEIKFEMDVQLSARQCSDRAWKQVNLFLMELHHTPVQMSAMGLFDISKTTLSSAGATAISILLVLIQYS